jgi:hypothetical protein
MRGIMFSLRYDLNVYYLDELRFHGVNRNLHICILIYIIYPEDCKER